MDPDIKPLKGVGFINHGLTLFSVEVKHARENVDKFVKGPESVELFMKTYERMVLQVGFWDI